MLYPATGEIYGVPLETGEFPITVKAEFSNPQYLPSYADLTLTVLDNTDNHVFTASDPGYEVEHYIGTQILTSPGSSEYYYTLMEMTDQLFVSAGAYDEFIDLWLNGEKLVDGEDYTKESGSTRITVRRQTIENKVNKDGVNTIAAEFRVGGDLNNPLKRTAQNFRVDIRQTGGSDREDSSDKSSRSGSSESRGEESAAADTVIASATAVIRLTDISGNSLKNTVLELHSTPQTAKTGQNGTAVFGGVEEGSHMLYVKDGSGNVLASRGFELLFGDSTLKNGDQFIVKAGSTFTVHVQMSGNELTFLELQEGDVYRVTSAGTGDDSMPGLWFALMLFSGSMGLWMVYESRRKKLIG